MAKNQIICDDMIPDIVNFVFVKSEAVYTVLTVDQKANVVANAAELVSFYSGIG